MAHNGAAERGIRARPAGLWLVQTLKRLAARLPIHVAVIGLVAIWSLPTLALLVRPRTGRDDSSRIHRGSVPPTWIRTAAAGVAG